MTNNEVDITKERYSNAPSHATLFHILEYTQYFMNLMEFISEHYMVEYTTWDDYHMKNLTVSS